ncbi:MAG: hypothetical protein JWO09_2899 [Bacteroidetes bacterium]|nr:hypothetical protein [Bacteroidota bacterium]
MKILRLITVTAAAFFHTSSQGQNTIDVAESTLKVSGLSEEIFYYGFSEGDQLIFSFEELNRKELKEIEIIELPASSKFMDYKTARIDNKTITITNTGIYKFRFSNSALTGRICKFKIQRIPADQSKKFNTNVYWKTVYDTTYTTVQEKYLIKSDTIINNITDQVAKVHSQGNMDGNKSYFNFSLPPNTISWSYYIGVDQGGMQAYQNATALLAKNAGPIASKLPGYGPLASLALGGASYIAQLQSGEDIDFWIVQGDNANLWQSDQQFYYIKKGKVLNDYSRMLSPLKGNNLFVCLSNDNAITGVQVTVKITAISVNEEWGLRPIQKMHISSKQVAYLKN